MKTRENAAVLEFLAIDNFDFTRKIVKKSISPKKIPRFFFFLSIFERSENPPEALHFRELKIIIVILATFGMKIQMQI
mgnify:CR=1 FL=1